MDTSCSIEFQVDYLSVLFKIYYLFKCNAMILLFPSQFRRQMTLRFSPIQERKELLQYQSGSRFNLA